MTPSGDDLTKLPAGLPAPSDDGACAHLAGSMLPDLWLATTGGRRVNLRLPSGLTVVYCYPRTGRPDEEVPAGWDEIPGASGCTPQSCGYRDHVAEFRELGVRVFGLSTQSTDYQREAAGRLHLPFELLSDSDLVLTHALNLPTFRFGGDTLTKRLTLVIRDGRIVHVFYPVFPPDEDAARVLDWLRRSGMLRDSSAPAREEAP